VAEWGPVGGICKCAGGSVCGSRPAGGEHAGPVRLKERASPGRGIYAGVLGGIEGMVKSFAAELRPVRVNGGRRRGRHGIAARFAGGREGWRHSKAAAPTSRSDRSAAWDIAEAYCYLTKTVKRPAQTMRPRRTCQSARGGFSPGAVSDEYDHTSASDMVHEATREGHRCPGSSSHVYWTYVGHRLAT